MKSSYLVLITVLTVSFLGCYNLKQVEREFRPPEQISRVNEDAEYLKSHMKNGDIYIFNEWSFVNDDSTIAGKGEYFDAYRNRIDEGEFILSIQDIELIESNVVSTSNAATGLIVLTGISAGMTVFCLTNTKACFGSCPTFYSSDGDSLGYLEAEGFSASILPSLEATDIDALKYVKAKEGYLNLTLTNEALETHNIRSTHILAIEHDHNESVHADPNGQFFITKSVDAKISFENEDGFINELLEMDGDFYSTKTDSLDLVTKEEIQIVSDEKLESNKQYGLVISARQSLLSTFLFYQALSYLGDDATYVLAKLESMDGDRSEILERINQTLGGIEIKQERSLRKDKVIGEFRETGPLATDSKMILLPKGMDLNELYIRHNLGHWRIDEIKLVEVVSATEAKVLSPEVYSINGEYLEEQTEALNDETRFLTNLPGDEYEMKFKLNDTAKHQSYFLQSRGYYLEWMRNEWNREKDLAKALSMFLDSKSMFREMAPIYKEMEDEMDNIFWNSKYVKN